MSNLQEYLLTWLLELFYTNLALSGPELA